MLDLAHIAGKIAGKYDTDKAVHASYLRNYENYFDGLRAEPVRLLELGIEEVACRRGRQELNFALYRLTRILARAQQHTFSGRLPLAGWLPSRVKAMIVGAQYHRHDYGMVGFAKELIDEPGAADITYPQRGVGAHRESKFRELRISPSHLFIIKA